MNKVTLTKNITRGEELVIIPKKEYDKFLAAYREREADEDIRRGRLSRAYKTKKELKTALNKLKK